MNNTKWRELVKILTHHGNYKSEVRTKYLNDEKEPTRFCYLSWDEVEDDGFEYIEWMEIDPVKRENVGQLVKPK